MKPLEHVHEYFLTAAECDAHGRMPLTLMVERIIETATEHANRLGIGFVDLKRHDIGWVLSRLSIDLDERPRMNTRYQLRTYINDLNRRYSTRTHELSVIEDGSARVVGHSRTVWMAINTSTRTAADLSVINGEYCVRPDSPCPVEAPARFTMQGQPVYRGEYMFRYTDIDVNGHVNSVRYLDTILESRPMEWHDSHDIARFDIIYHRECLWHQHVEVNAVSIESSKILGDKAAFTDEVAIERDGQAVVQARICWV